MTDREKVIKGLELCKQDAKLCFSETECPYQCEFPRCCLKLMADALELLKEQETVPVYEDRINKCKCGETVCRYWHTKFCGFCGRKLLWY